MSDVLARLGLAYNPFAPSASGAPIGNSLWLPRLWKERLEGLLDSLNATQGVRAVAIFGEYGSGKSYVMQWMNREELPRRGIQPYYFDNPGVQFYDLANSLFRQIGRKSFSKSLWELAAPYVGSYQRSLFLSGFEEYLRGQARGRGRQQQTEVLSDLQEAIKKVGITQDEEIAHRLARVVVDTPTKPYFEYRDFVGGKSDSLVAEREEAPYFSAVLKTLRLSAGITSVAFLLDEFEEVALQKNLTRHEAHLYLATLKRLINLTQGDDLLLILAMTPDAVEKTQALEPALWERMTGNDRYAFSVPPLQPEEAVELVKSRLAAARDAEETARDDLFPFPRDFETILTPATVSSPRELTKVCSIAIGGASNVEVPFTDDYLVGVEHQVARVFAGKP